MTPLQAFGFLLAVIAVAIMIAPLVNRVKWAWKWRKFIQAVESSAQRDAILSRQRRDAFYLREQDDALGNCEIASPHKSAARPSNVRAILQKQK